MKKGFTHFFLFLFFFLGFLGAHRLIEVTAERAPAVAQETFHEKTFVLSEGKFSVKEEGAPRREKEAPGFFINEKLKSRQQQRVMNHAEQALMAENLPYYRAVYYAFNLGDKAG